VHQAVYESRAAAAVFAAAPSIAQQAPSISPSQHEAAAKQKAQDRHSTASTAYPAPSAAFPKTSTAQVTQASPSATQNSALSSAPVSKPAEAAIRTATTAPSKAAAKGESADDGVELSPEELGFAGHSEDAFAALRAKMVVAQGKKKKKDKRGTAAVEAVLPSEATAAALPATAETDAVAVHGAAAQAGQTPADLGTYKSCAVTMAFICCCVHASTLSTTYTAQLLLCACKWAFCS